MIIGNLVIQGQGGELMLQDIQFYGMNSTPNGLDMRVRYNGNIQSIRFVRRLEDTFQPIVHHGPVLYKSTGPADVYKAMNIPTEQSHELMSQTAVNQSELVKHPPPSYPLMNGEPIPKIIPGRMLFRDLPSPTVRAKQRTSGPYERQDVASPQRLPDFNPLFGHQVANQGDGPSSSSRTTILRK